MSETNYDALLEQFAGNDRYVKFINDMRAARIEVRTYSARGSYDKECPASTTNDEIDAQDIIRATSVRLKTDQLGRRLILYP